MIEEFSTAEMTSGEFHEVPLLWDLANATVVELRRYPTTRLCPAAVIVDSKPGPRSVTADHELEPFV